MTKPVVLTACTMANPNDVPDVAPHPPALRGALILEVAHMLADHRSADVPTYPTLLLRIPDILRLAIVLLALAILALLVARGVGLVGFPSPEYLSTTCSSLPLPC